MRCYFFYFFPSLGTSVLAWTNCEIQKLVLWVLLFTPFSCISQRSGIENPYLFWDYVAWVQSRSRAAVFGRLAPQ